MRNLRQPRRFWIAAQSRRFSIAASQSGDQSPQAKTGPNSTSPYLTPDI